MPPTTRSATKKRLLAALVFFILPVLTGVAICMILYHHHAPAGTQPQGAFNTRLPPPNLKKTEKNKLELSLDAEKDSLRREQQLHSDPYARVIKPVATPTAP